MAKRKRQSDPSDSGLKDALLQELATLDLSLEELAEREARIHDELESVQRERKRNQELREHARALLAPREQAHGPAFSSGPSLSTTMVDREEAMEVPDLYLDGHRPNTSDILAQAVYETLKETEPTPGEPGEPMHYRDLVAALESRKIFISGRDRGLNLVAHIHNDPNFVRPKRGMYGLKEWYPATQHNVGKRT